MTVSLHGWSDRRLTHFGGGEPPNQRKLGGLSLGLTEVDYGDVGTHPPTLRCESVGTDGRERSFHELHCE